MSSFEGVPDATCQLSLKSARRFRRNRFLKGFYHIWARRPSWSCDPDAANKLLKMFEIVDDGRTDARSMGILLAHR